MALLHRELAGIVGADQVLEEPADLLVYESDGLTYYRSPPAAVVLPGSTAEVAAVVRYCAARRLPFVPRGAGTGLSGGALPPPGGVVIELARMKQVVEVHPKDQLARVQVGLVNLELSRAVARHGLFYAPDPSSQSACTIGGNVAENSGGPHCMKYGMTTHHVLGLTVVTPEGEVVQLGGPAPDPEGYDLVGLFVGSEGTFGIATEAWVRLTPRPPATRTLLLAFHELRAACVAVGQIVSRGVIAAALEMLDRKTIEVIEASVLAAGYPVQAGAVLLAELDGLSQQVEADAAVVRRISEQHGCFQIQEASDAEERARLWKGRKGAFGALGRLKPDLYVQDAVVPRSKLPEVLDEVLRIARRHDVLLTNVFHAGDGNLHPNISYDGRDEHEVRRVLAAGEEILDLCLRAGGSLSGEHGIGREKRDAMTRLFAPEDLDLFRKVRCAFNPAGLCNPDKVLPGAKICSEFRRGVAIPGVTDG